MAQDYLVPWLNASGQGGLRNSMLVAAGDGSTVQYSINFSGGYLVKTDIKAYTFNPATGVTTALTITSGMWTSANQITLASPVPVGQYIVIYRDTQKTSPLVNFSTGAILNEPNLDKMAQQCVFIAAEMLDRFDAVNDGSTLAITNSATALATANTAYSTANIAKATADAATTTANGAVTTANSATTTAGNAVTIANGATATANGINAKAQSALDASAAATTTANTAKTTADGINAKAQSALDNSSAAVSTANNAKSTADGLASSIATANTNASNAVSTANNAAAAVSQFTGKSRIINGSAVVAQRGPVTLATAAGTLVGNYGGPDRFAASNSAGGSFTQSQSTFVFNGLNRYCVKQVVNTVMTNSAGTNYWSGIGQPIEGFNAYDLKGQPISISFIWLSSLSGNFSVAVRDNGGTYSYVTTFTATANVPQKVVLNLPAVPASAAIPASSALGMTLWIGAINTGTYLASAGNQNAWVSGNYASASSATNWGLTSGASISVAELQLEAGTAATPFEQRPYGVEFALCQRYYQVTTSNIISGYANANNGVYGTYPRQVVMRSSPTSAIIGTPSYLNSSGLSIFYSSPDLFKMTLVITATGTGYADGVVVTSNAEL